MMFGFRVLSFALAASLQLSSTASTVSAAQIRGTEKRSSVEIPQNALGRFKEDNLLRNDFNPPGQQVTGDTFQIGLGHISFADWDLSPVDSVFTSGAEFYLDGEKQGLPRANVFRSKADPTVLVFKDDGGNLRRAVKTDRTTGASIALERVQSNAPVFVQIRPGDVDEAKLNRFKYGDSDPPSESEESLRNRVLSQIDEQVDQAPMATHSRSLQGGCSSYDVIEVALAYESLLCDFFGGAEATNTAIQDIVIATSEKFQQLCVKVEISYLEGYCDPATDPYQAFFNSENAVCGGDANILDDFRAYWNTNRVDVSRSVAHLFHDYAHPSSTIGCAYTGVLCWKNYGYGVNEIGFTTNTILHAVLFSHELGHSAASPHYTGTDTGDFIMQPSICDCHTFHPESIAAMEAEIASVTCLGTAEGDSVPTSPPSESPITAAPTTMEPTTQSPTTAAPTSSSPTQSPTTAVPTRSPTTASPTTAAPTQNPTTASPTTKPTTQNPTTASPTTTPTTESPTTVSPTTAAPTQSPTTASPTDSPTTVAPTTAAPTQSPTTKSPTARPTAMPSPSPTEYCAPNKFDPCDVNPCCPGLVCKERGNNGLNCM